MRASYDPRTRSTRHRNYVGNGTVSMHIIRVASTTACTTGTTQYQKTHNLYDLEDEGRLGYWRDRRGGTAGV